MFDFGGPGLKRLMNKKMAGLLQNAPFIFAPENGLAYFEDLGWRVLESDHLMAAAKRFRRLPIFMWPALWGPQPNPRHPGGRPWSATALLTRRDNHGRTMISRRELAKYAAAAALLGLAAARRRRASADNPRLIDFAERRIAPDEIKAAGYAGVVNYVSEARPGANFEAKPLTREYADCVARGRFTHRQQLPVRQAERNRPVGLHPRLRRRRG